DGNAGDGGWATTPAFVNERLVLRPLSSSRRSGQRAPSRTVRCTFSLKSWRAELHVKGLMKEYRSRPASDDRSLSSGLRSTYQPRTRDLLQLLVHQRR